MRKRSILISPTGNATQKFETLGNGFRIKYVAIADINPKTDIGCHGHIEPLFVKYFYTDLFGSSGFCSDAKPADGSGLKIVGVELELYSKFPDINLEYYLTDSDTGEDVPVAAKRLLPFKNGYFTYTPTGSVRSLGRIVFLIPGDKTKALLSYSTGGFKINFADKSIEVAPGSE